MLTSSTIFEKAKNKKGQIMVVTCPYDYDTIQACEKALEMELCEIVFVGDLSKITNLISKEKLDNLGIDVYNEIDDIASAKKSMELINAGKANLLMKGLIDTSLLLKTFLSSEYNLRTNQLLSHVGLLMKEDCKTYFVTDAAMNIAPTLEQKVSIINNAVVVARALGIEKPVVANLCAKEKKYDKMPATIDADALHQMNLDGSIKDCYVSGPMQMDNVLSKESCEIKGLKEEACGASDILMCPTIEVGNVLAKGLKYLSGYSFCGVVVGAKVPIVLVSRADDFEEKLLSIAVASCI